MPRYDLLVFDFDGTLVDTAADIAEHVNAVLGEFGRPGRSLKEVQKAIGRGMRELLKGVGFPEGDPSLEAAAALLRLRYAESPIRHSRAYPGVVEALAGPLKDLPKAIVTNKPQFLTDKILGELDLARHFGLVLGDGAGFPRKPDPASLRHCLAHFRAEPERTLFIGDSLVDHQTASGAGVDFVWADYGYDDALSGRDGVRRSSGAADWAGHVF
ncbi:MAG TPA: HAD-IA family hydrolase [Candidatus Eisenbacteria bacterium]|nr:HAD-IA family hydrolase [Candidatus Eisenbacteria bacterium]